MGASAADTPKVRLLPSDRLHYAFKASLRSLSDVTQDGLRGYYKAKIEELEVAVRNKTQNLRRLEAQRNELNTQGALVSVPSSPATSACRGRSRLPERV